MSDTFLPVYSARQTADLLDFKEMVTEIKQASQDLHHGTIQAPNRQAVNYPDSGVMLSMPATGNDIGIHKLVNVMGNNASLGLPAIHGLVTAFCAKTGKELGVFHGQTVTELRTAAVSMVGLDIFTSSTPTHVCIVGYGKQALGHLKALNALYPGIKVTITGRDLKRAQFFVTKQKVLDLDLNINIDAKIPTDCDVVITVTTSDEAFYDYDAIAGRLVVAVGAFNPQMAEISANTINNSQVYVDEINGAKHEAGDLIKAKINWDSVKSIYDAQTDGVNYDQPIFYKTVGCAAWDLAVIRGAMKRVETT